MRWTAGAALPTIAAMLSAQLSMVAVVFVLAGAVKGVTGMGLPTVAMSLLGLWMLPLEAAALLVVPSLLTNVAQCRGPHLRSLALRLWPGWVAGALLTVATPDVGQLLPAEFARLCLGAILIAYGVWGLWRPSLPDFSARGNGLSAVFGALSGVVTAVTAVFVVPWVPYLQTLKLSKDEMVQALGLSFTVVTVALALRVQSSMPPGWWSAAMAVTLGVALVGSFVGLQVGARLRGRLAGPAFQKALFAVFVALGVANLTQAL